MYDEDKGGFISKIIGPKRAWRDYKARKAQLPGNYRIAIDAVEHYLMYAGGGGDGAGWATVFEDLVDLFEQSAANGTPIREVVGDDPVAFVEVFIQNYPAGGWIRRERERLASAIDRAANDQSANTDGEGSK
jgi:DNA-binding ferritin-like protein (Dps family)